MMVVVPVNGNIHKTNYITNEFWQQILKRLPIIAMRNLQFLHHDCNDNGYYSITECFQSVFIHRIFIFFRKILAVRGFYFTYQTHIQSLKNPFSSKTEKKGFLF
jgi:hypothetical protein